VVKTIEISTLQFPEGKKMQIAQSRASFEAIKERLEALELAFTSTETITERSPEAQEAFILVLSDLRLIDFLIGQVESGLNGLKLSGALCGEALEVGLLDKDLAEIAREIVATIVSQFGIENEVVVKALIKSLALQIELVESILNRAEKNMAIVAG
jgi:hypothetical protein